MAEWLPAGIGLMAGVCAFGLLGVARARGATYGPWLSGAPHNVRAFVLEAARRLGDAVPAALANWLALRSCADEMRHISVLTRWVMRDARVERRRTRRPMRASADGPNQGNGSLAREERPTSARTGVSALPREALDDVACRGLFLMADALCGMAGAVIALSPLGLVVGAGAPWLLFSARAARRARAAVRKVEAEMPEAFDALAIALGSGHSLSQGMRFVGSHAQEPVRTEFMRVSYAIECGVPATSALDDLLERLPAPGLGLVSLALKVSQRTGAPLRDLLADAADMVAERMELVRRLDVKTSQARMSARLVALMPLAMIAMLTLLSPDFRAGLATPLGMGSVLVALVLNLMAWGIIRHIMEVDVS